ncbi:unnamed protein product, partial [Rotaria socialis]
RQFESAAFWGDKLLSLNRNSSDDLLLVAKCFMSNGDYNRTRILLENSPLYHVTFEIFCHKLNFRFCFS